MEEETFMTECKKCGKYYHREIEKQCKYCLFDEWSNEFERKEKEKEIQREEKEREREEKKKIEKK
jgi:hypothetical protein